MSRKEPCRYCDDAHRDRECKRWVSPETSCLSNNDTDSQPVCISNIRVWREMHAESEDQLWRYQTDAYGSTWIEVRAELVDLTDREPLYRRAAALGLTGLTSVVDSLCSLESYPILDEEDESQAEQEEQEEHWESYGRSDVERAVESAFESKHGEDSFQVASDALEESGKTFSDMYWGVCHEIGEYPQRIDSSAWDFGERTDGYRKGWVVAPMVERFEDLLSRSVTVDG